MISPGWSALTSNMAGVTPRSSLVSGPCPAATCGSNNRGILRVFIRSIARIVRHMMTTGHIAAISRALGATLALGLRLLLIRL
tara:strand:+ start:650 stop:898 length:249 start_codon:yes stop_codon:yes gene_type:complete